MIVTTNRSVACYICIPNDRLPHYLEQITVIFQYKRRQQVGNDESNQWQHDLSIPNDKRNLLCDLFFTYSLVHG